MPARTGVTAPHRVTAAEKRHKAVLLRRAGATWEVIAREAGYAGRQSAQAAVKKYLDSVAREDAAEMRIMEGERLDALQAAVWKNAMAGDAEAVRAALRVMERRARMNGIDQPVEFQLRLDNEQVDYLESVLRRVLDAVHTALAVAGAGPVLDEVWPTIMGEVVAGELEAAAAAADVA